MGERARSFDRKAVSLIKWNKNLKPDWDTNLNYPSAGLGGQIVILDWFSPQWNEKSNFGSQNPDLDWSKGTQPVYVCPGLVTANTIWEFTILWTETSFSETCTFFFFIISEKISTNVKQIPTIVMPMPTVPTPRDPSPARVIVDLKAMELHVTVNLR